MKLFLECSSSSSAISSVNSILRVAKLWTHASARVKLNRNENTWRKNTSEKQLRLGTTRHDQDGIGKFTSPIPTQREMGIDQVGLMSSGCLPGSPGSLRFVAQNPRIPATSNSENLVQQQLVFISCLRVFSLCVRCTAHCHQQCVSAHLANSASHISSDRLFFAGS